MHLDPKVQQFLERHHTAGDTPPNVLSLSEVLRQVEEASVSLGPSPLVRSVEDRHIAGSGSEILACIHRHTGAPRAPRVVCFHGGSWAMGSIPIHDKLRGELTRDEGAVVASVDYRLVPELILT